MIPHDRVGPCLVQADPGATPVLVVPVLGAAGFDCLRIPLRPVVLAALVADGARILQSWTAKQCLDNEARRAAACETERSSVGAAPALSAPSA